MTLTTGSVFGSMTTESEIERMTEQIRQREQSAKDAEELYAARFGDGTLAELQKRIAALDSNEGSEVAKLRTELAAAEKRIYDHELRVLERERDAIKSQMKSAACAYDARRNSLLNEIRRQFEASREYRRLADEIQRAIERDDRASSLDSNYPRLEQALTDLQAAYLKPNPKAELARIRKSAFSVGERIVNSVSNFLGGTDDVN